VYSVAIGDDVDCTTGISASCAKVRFTPLPDLPGLVYPGPNITSFSFRVNQVEDGGTFQSPPGFVLVSLTGPVVFGSRTQAGLLALYDFTEGVLERQTSVCPTDSSGLNFLGNLSAGEPGTQWKSTVGLTVVAGINTRAAGLASTATMSSMLAGPGGLSGDTSTFSMEAWVQLRPGPFAGETPRFILGVNDVVAEDVYFNCPIGFYGNSVSGTNYWRFRYPNSAKSGGCNWLPTVTTNATADPHHLVMAVAANSVKFYVDTTLVWEDTANAWDNPPFPSASTFEVLRTRDSVTPLPSIDLFLFAMYDHQLSVAEVQANFDAGRPRNPPTTAAKGVSIPEDVLTSFAIPATPALDSPVRPL
jgi:hypothetical protein